MTTAARTLFFLVAFSSFLTMRSMATPTDQASRFTVQDDISLTKFEDVSVSPTENMVAVITEQASLKDGRLHDTLRTYSLNTIREVMDASDVNHKAEPVWTFEESASSGDGIEDRISHIGWLSDGSGFAFLYQIDRYHHRLYLAKIASKQVVSLSPEGDDVLGFTIRDSSHYVFTVASQEAEKRLEDALKTPFRVGTGRSLEQLAFPEDTDHDIQRGEVWAAIGGEPFSVRDPKTGLPITLFSDGSDSLSLSPDGKMLVTVQAVDEVPADWEDRFPPPFPTSAYRLREHHQDLTVASDGGSYVGQYVCIDLARGIVSSLTGAPASLRAGWWEIHAVTARWSQDGSTILLPGTFTNGLVAKDARPCVVVVQFRVGKSECVRPLKRQFATGYEQGYEVVDDIEFIGNRNDAISLRHINHDDDSGDKTIIYVRTPAGSWRLTEVRTRPSSFGGLLLKVNEDFRTPPVLVARDPVSNKARPILDPNPQLRQIARGEAERYTWRDSTGREWLGILYKPVGYQSQQAYPLVIQNHGLSMDHFVPSGAFPSAFIAQELASAGIMVLQVRDCAGRSTPEEGPCNVEGYESAVAKLSRDGLVDPSRVGIIGFSRTVYYVLEALTLGKVHFKAASITDGMNFGYMNYLQSIGLHGFLNDEVGVIGSEPFGPGLSKWIKASPTFSFDRVTAPLRVVSMRGSSVVGMWEPYALLEAMHKPVDFIVLNTREHSLTDPAIRLAAQGGNVDWFRFWLQDYEDPDPMKRDQYMRWHNLRNLTTGSPGNLDK